MNDDGRVQLEVSVFKPGRRFAGEVSTTVSLLRGTASDDVRWVDAQSPLAQGDAAHPVRLADAGPQAEPARIKVRVADPEPPRTTSTQATGAGCQVSWKVVATSNRMGAIAHTYVPSGTSSKAWAYHSRSRSHTFGTAGKVNSGGWEVSGSRTYTAGDSFTWIKNRARTRSYRVQIRYGKYFKQSEYFDPNKGYGCDNIYRWQAMYNTGGRGEKTYDTTPTWGTTGNCAPFPAGEWKRERSDGKNFSLSGGVLVSDLIGFNLKSARTYASNAYIAYSIVGKKTLCGNNHVPLYASSVRMKKTW